MEEILHSMSTKYYKSDQRIQNTVKGVIRMEAEKGRVVILGRGGSGHYPRYSRSLHIQVEHPLNGECLELRKFTIFDNVGAQLYVNEIDKKREAMRVYFGGKRTDYTRFDLTFNAMTLSVKEIVDIIIYTMEVRKPD